MSFDPAFEQSLQSRVRSCLVFTVSCKQGHWFSFEKRVGKGAGGKVFRETFSRLKGWKNRFFFLDQRDILNTMAWIHHDSNVNDPVLKVGLNILDVQVLTAQCIDLRPVSSGLLFRGVLSTTWDFPSFLPIFKDTEGNEHSKEKATEVMTETMEKYTSKTRGDYGSGVIRHNIDVNAQFELKGKFLKEHRDILSVTFHMAYRTPMDMAYGHEQYGVSLRLGYNVLIPVQYDLAVRKSTLWYKHAVMNL
nr:hypothetical protein [Tanacetum cinerariifolium]